MSARRGPMPVAGMQHGLGAVAALVVLVVLAGVAAAIVRLGQGANQMLAQEVGATKASLAARAGVEWGLYQAFKGSWTACNGSTQTLDLRSDTGMSVTVSCSSTAYNDGEQSPGVARSVRVFTIDAVACNSATACPDATLAASPGYVERRRQVQATD